jgi:exodeoxyribonuclease-3
MIKIISWNINSLRLRLSQLKILSDKYKADIVCLQETKVENSQFPFQEIKKMGFKFIEFDGEKSYNGVAILSKIPLQNINKIDVLNYRQKRHISASINFLNKQINLHNFYVPAGGDIPDISINPKFDHKLKFIDWMIDYFKYDAENNIILGDFNIAPSAHDVWSHRQLINVVSHTPIEVEKLSILQNSGNFLDCHRYFFGENAKLYSWWSYRAIDPFKSNRGRRLDHIWISKNLQENLSSANILKEYRLENSPSDHVPILIELKL